MADLSPCLAGCKLFSKIDLQKRYLQVPVAEADIAKTAIITPFGLYEFLRTPFGLRNAGMTFQHLMDGILNGLPFVFVYLDDILIASPCEQSHRCHVASVLRILQDNGLLINASKCIFGVETIEVLGHEVTPTGIRPLADRVAAARRFPTPSTVRELQAFLCLFNYYRQFVKGAAKLLLPLTSALVGSPPGKTRLAWFKEMAAAFSSAKEANAAACELQHPLPAAEISLATDASATHVGAVLQQRLPGTSFWRPPAYNSAKLSAALAFYSAKLSAAQKNYSAFDREQLAIYLSFRHFSPISRPPPTSTGARGLCGARFVFVKAPAAAPALAQAYRGPYRVIEEGPKSFKVLVGGRPDVISVDRLKPYLGGDEPVPATPPRRGRPPMVPSTLPGTLH
jgi:cleavage and polyadenylation specificity factor subunit 1